MARKPKTAPSGGDKTRVEDSASVSEGATVRKRGRLKSLPASAQPAPAITTSDQDRNQNIGEAGGGAVGLEEPRVRRRPGPRPKHLDEKGAARQLGQDAKPKRGQKARLPALASAASDVDAAGLASQSEETAGSDEARPHASADRVASIPARAEASTKAAAEWDQATDTVTFDWTAIERTAAQAGPNQVMAKLLVAARAEGANSRWPL